MSVTLNASTSSGLIATSDTSGQIELQANGVTRLTVSSSGVSFTSASTAAPTFSAYQSSAQSLSSGTWTKINLQTEEWDTNNNFDSATNYRFTPTVAGYYQINGNANGNSNVQFIVAIYKNGTEYRRGGYVASTTAIGNSVASVVYFNGSSDYVEL